MSDKKNADRFAQGVSRLNEIGHRLDALFGKSKSELPASTLFTGLGSLVEQLGKLAEQAEHSGGAVSRSGELDLGSGNKGVYGFSIKSGLGEKPLQVEPFGNIRRDEEGKLVAVQEIREPMLDMFDEPGRLQLVAEVPGVEEGDVQIELHDDILLISTEKGEHRYRKEVLLPSSFAADQMSFRCRNGILEIQLLKDSTGEGT
ncbi:MAG: Hsp20/alpha crystallin family protein [Rhodoferax sp.]